MADENGENQDFILPLLTTISPSAHLHNGPAPSPDVYSGPDGLLVKRR